MVHCHVLSHEDEGCMALVWWWVGQGVLTTIISFHCEVSFILFNLPHIQFVVFSTDAPVVLGVMMRTSVSMCLCVVWGPQRLAARVWGHCRITENPAVPILDSLHALTPRLHPCLLPLLLMRV